MALLTTFHTSNIASLYLTSLLTWAQLPTLIALNSERLSDSYRLLATTLRSYSIEFIVPTHGIFLFAKLARNAKNAKDETAFFDRLAIHGILVGPGQFYKGVETEFGWARIRYSLPVPKMQKVLDHLSAFLVKEGFSVS